MLDEDVAGSYRVVLGPQYEEGEREVVTAAECARKGIRVVVEASKANSGAEFRMAVTNGSDRELSEVVFPDLRLDAKGAGSGFTMPVGPGWWQPFEFLSEGEHINWNYPVHGSMQWVDYCDESSGVYVGVHDATPYIKLFTVGKQDGRPWVRVRFTDIRLMPDETFELPAVAVREHDGDWHAGADIYRAWAESWMQKPSGAKWYDDAPAWSWVHLKGQHAPKPDRLFSDLPEQARIRGEYGIKLSNVSGWLEYGHDTHYPDYTAGDCMGSEQGLAKAVDDVHAMGLRISLYTNGRIVDPQGSISRNRDWLSWAVQAPGRDTLAAMQQLHANHEMPVNTEVEWNIAGAAATESYGSERCVVDFAVMCPGCREWRELFIRRLEHVARAYRVDGSFVDQVCGCWAYPCYSSDHDHSRPNESWRGYLALLAELRTRLRAINPEFSMSTEGVCDILGQYFDIQQGHNDWDTQVGAKSIPMPELYGYTFPWYTVNAGYASHNNYYFLKLAHAVGSGLDVCAIEPEKLEERFLRYLKLIMAWRKRYVEVLRRGEFVGALECDSPHYLAHAFEKNGRLVVTAAWAPCKCDPDRPETVTLNLRSRAVKSAKLLTEDGEREVSVEVDGTDSVVHLPLSEIAVLEAA